MLLGFIAMVDETQSQVETGDLDEALNLGGNIQLSGFKVVDRGSMVIVKKLVGTYARKFSDHNQDFRQLSLRLKPVHANEEHQIHHIDGKLVIGGNTFASEVEDRNLFFAIDTALKKLENSI